MTMLALMMVTSMLNARNITERLVSPDGNLELTFSLTQEGTPCYALNYAGREVIKESPLGYTLRGDASAKKPETYMHVTYDAVDFGSGFSFVEATRSEFDQTWEPVWGEESQIRNHYNEMAVTLEQKNFKGKEGNDGLKKEIQDYVKTHTAPYKYPRIVEFVSELPKTISGKVRRVEIRKNDIEKMSK